MSECEHANVHMLRIQRRDIWLCSDCGQSASMTRSETVRLAQGCETKGEYRAAIAKAIDSAAGGHDGE
jgi:hypothetical protein